MIELKEGTFLVLEMIQEQENSGDYVQVQGKYLPVIRRGILLNSGFLSEDNGSLSIIFQGLWKDFEGLWKTMAVYQRIIDYSRRQSKTMKDNEG